MRQAARQRLWTAAALVSALVALIVDLSLPLGIRAGALYVIPILLALGARKHGVPVTIAIVSLVFVWLGYLYSPAAPLEIPLSHLVWNRALSSLVIAATLGLVVVNTVRQQREEATRQQLARTNAQLRATLESMTDAFVLLDRDWHITYVNARALGIIGRTAQQLVGQHVWDAFPEARGTIIEDRYTQARDSGRPVEFSVRFDPLHGWFQERVFPTAEGLAIYFREIGTERSREHQLALLETAISRLNDGVVITEAEPLDAPGPRIVFANDAFLRLCGRKLDEVLGQSPRFVQGPDTRRETLDVVRRALESGKAVSVELTNYHSSGRRYLVELHITPILDAEGRCSHFVAIQRDVTERRALEDQLRHSQKMDSIGQLTGGIAHDFNNLLTVIRGNAEALAGIDADADPERRRQLALMIGAAAQRGAELTQRLLAFARRQALDPHPTDVAGLLKDIQPLLERALGDSVELSVEAREQPWNALVDPAQLEAAVLNLCLNARDAMPAGGRVAIELRNAFIDRLVAAEYGDIAPGEYLDVCVTDNGQGIHRDHLERVFEPFFTTKPSGKGSGLGLSMVYGFVKQSGGHVRIDSEPGQGTAVRLFLPRVHQEAGRHDTDPSQPTPSKGEAVLLVEDDDLVRRYAEGLLKGLGYRVVSAPNGQEALDVLRSGADCDLLFSDVVMPGLVSGPELARQARELRPGLKVLFASGYAESALVHNGRLEAGVQLLNKPYRRIDLARKLRQVLEGG